MALAVGLALPGLAVAQGAAPKEKAKKGEDAVTTLYEVGEDSTLFSFDYGPPTSPALKLLGAAGDSLTPSTSLTKFVLSLPTVLDGKNGQAIAFDAPPAALWRQPADQTFRRYIAPGGEGYAFRMQHRTRLGIAAMTGDEGGGDAAKAIRSRLTLGVSASMLDSADPLVTGKRDRFDQPLLASCLSALAPRVQTIVDFAATPSPEEARLHQRQLAFLTAARHLKLLPPGGNSSPTSDDYNAARGVLAPYVPGATGIPADAPQVTAPRLSEAQQAKAARLAALRAMVAGKPDEIAKPYLALVDEMEKEYFGARPAVRAEAPETPTRLTDAELLALVKGEQLAIEDEGQNAIVQAQAARAKTATEAIVKAKLDKDFARCALVSSRMARFSPDLDLGAGVLWRGDPGELGGFKAGGQVVWVAFKYPFGVKFPEPDARGLYGDIIDQSVPMRAWVAALSGRISRGEYVATGDKLTPEFKSDARDIWVGVERLSETRRFSVQYGWHEIEARDPLGKPFEESGERYLVSGQFKMPALGEGAWLGLSYGNAYGTVDKLDDVKALITLSYTPPPPANIAKDK